MAAFDVEFGVDPPRASPDRDFCPGFVLQIKNTLPTDVAVRVTTVCGRQRHHNANYAAPAPAFSLWDFALYRRVSMSKEIHGERYNGGGGERKN